MKLSQVLSLVLAPMLVSGCYGSTESFSKKSAQIFCQNLEECNKATFEASYSSMSDCVETSAEDNVDAFSLCEYDAAQGRECIKVSKKYKTECNGNLAELQEVVDACRDVYYSCDGQGGVGLSYDPSTGQLYITPEDLLTQ